MNRKWLWAIVFIVIIVVAVFCIFFLFPSMEQNSLAIQFYDENQNPVGEPQRVYPLAPVLIEGVEVTFFTVNVSWFTNDPRASALDWTVDLETYWAGPVYPYKVTYWEGQIWYGASTSGFWENGAGSTISKMYRIDDYVGLLPDETEFVMRFSGHFRFRDVTVDANPPYNELLYEADFHELKITCYHASFTYTARLTVR